MFRNGSRKQRRNGIANLSDLFLKIAGENKRVIKALKSGGLANGEAAMIAIMDETPGAGIGKVRRDSLRDAMPMETTIGLAQIFDFSAPVEPAAPIQILIAATFGNLLQLFFDEFFIMFAGEMIGQNPCALATRGLVIAERWPAIGNGILSGIQRWQISDCVFDGNERQRKKRVFFAMHRRIDFARGSQRWKLTPGKFKFSNAQVLANRDDESAFAELRHAHINFEMSSFP